MAGWRMFDPWRLLPPVHSRLGDRRRYMNRIAANPGHRRPHVPRQMARTSRIGANIATVVALSSWWAKHVPGEGRRAHHPRLAAISTPPGMDARPEPVPGLVPGARHDAVATTVP